ncbi:MAG: hypothetical protein K2X49_24740 [Acetobacteraceae bacterium]|nr:hypothetical protein [Acetobacteraceae bacterium]
MSALAHMIESRGVPAVAIGLVRPHLEATRAPRSLFVPFQLGRPLGEPGDAAFQRRVLLHALGLLERTDGPVILEDFAEDAPNERDTPGWRPPFALPAPPSADLPAALAAEIAHLRPWWDSAQARFGRTTVGLCGLPPEAWPGYAGPFLDGDVPEAPSAFSPALTLRYLADDLKAFCMEAVQAEGPAASSRQVNAWFWGGTAAGRMLLALRGVAQASEEKGLQTIARFLVPVPWLPADHQ